MYPGIFPGAVGYVCRIDALACIAGSAAASFLYLVPPLTAVMAWFWPGEAQTPLAVGGGILVLAGVILAHTRGRKPAN
ncbi:MAG TPA: EamA family transporter [Ktedonobacteraceae bacterium]|nr:EamA family transporter [Ktedonobacteraceae bacterium]